MLYRIQSINGIKAIIYGKYRNVTSITAVGFEFAEISLQLQ